MQTSKLILVISAVTMLAGFTLLRAVETEAQKRAREALRQKMQELEGQPQTPAPPAAATPTPPPMAPPPVAAPPATPPAAPVAVVPSQSSDTDAQARARAALRQAMGAGTAAPSEVVAGQPPAAIVWTSAGKDNPAQARAREALWQRMKELDAEEARQRELVFQRTPPPPVPAVSGAKAGRLAALLSRYRADTITPEDYHKQRAAILAEP